LPVQAPHVTPIDQLGALLEGEDGLVWVDIPTATSEPFTC
jgi:hypothetical protein